MPDDAEVIPLRRPQPAAPVAAAPRPRRPAYLLEVRHAGRWVVWGCGPNRCALLLAGQRVAGADRARVVPLPG